MKETIELRALVEKHFPNNQSLADLVPERKNVRIEKLCTDDSYDILRKIRQYPLEVQAGFFEEYWREIYLTQDIKLCGETPPVELLNMQGLGRLLALINCIPLKSREIDLGELTEDARKLHKALGYGTPTSLVVGLTAVEYPGLTVSSSLNTHDFGKGMELIIPSISKELQDYLKEHDSANAGLRSYLGFMNDPSHSCFPATIVTANEIIQTARCQHPRHECMVLGPNYSPFLMDFLTKLCSQKVISEKGSDPDNDHLELLVKMTRSGLFLSEYDKDRPGFYFVHLINGPQCDRGQNCKMWEE